MPTVRRWSGAAPTTARSRRRAVESAATGENRAGSPERRWLLLVHQLPTRLSKARVKTSRRLQQLGAVAIRNAVYVLPDSSQARECVVEGKDASSRSLRPAGKQVGLQTAPRLQDESKRVPVSFWRVALYFLRLGAIGFGGPIALVGRMQQDLVGERHWVTRKEYLEGLALSQLAPGPLAAQLAMYLGYIRGGIPGASIVAVLFILPSFLLVWAISLAYVSYGGLAWMQAVFYGVGAAVIGIIARSAWKLTRLTLGDRHLLWAIFAVLAASTALTQREILWLFVSGGLVALAASFPRRHTAVAAALPLSVHAAVTTASASSIAPLLWFFAKAGAFVFGSGLAIVPFLYGGVVQERHWLTNRQFLDAVAVAMITPGPVVITSAFIGYLVAGFPGMIAAATGVFLPVYLFVIVAAPYFHRYGQQPQVRAFVDGVTAAAAGAIAGAAVVLARRAFVDPVTVGIGVGTFVVLYRFKVSELWLIGAAALLGWWIRG